MMKKLSTDNPFFECMGNIGDWIILNLLFVITSFPVITIGMSLTAMYQVALRRGRGESRYTAREYLQACREEWKESTKLWVVFLLTGGLLLFDILYVKNLGSLMSIGIWALVIVWCAVFSYTFPLQARFRNTLINTLKNALCMAIKNLPYTILIAALNGITVMCIALGNFVTMMAMPIYCFIGFALTAKINSIFFKKIFQELTEKENINHENFTR